MPSSSEIVAQLARIANDALPGAVAWHAVIATALIAGFLGWRPSQRLIALGLAMPLASVAGFAFAFGSPFNAIVFTIIALVAAAMAAAVSPSRIEQPPWWMASIGTAAVLFAWLYPHFLGSHPATVYLYAAPVGLIPCPTLSLVIGVGLLCGGLGRAWAALFSAVGAFYALFGWLKLGVTLDLGLLAAALALGVVAVSGLRARAVAPPARPLTAG